MACGRGDSAEDVWCGHGGRQGDAVTRHHITCRILLTRVTRATPVRQPYGTPSGPAVWMHDTAGFSVSMPSNDLQFRSMWTAQKVTRSVQNQCCVWGLQHAQPHTACLRGRQTSGKYYASVDTITHCSGLFFVEASVPCWTGIFQNRTYYRSVKIQHIICTERRAFYE